MKLKPTKRTLTRLNLESLEARRLLHGGPLEGGDPCIDFEALPLGQTYNVGDSFTADPTGFQANVRGTPFVWDNNVVFNGGQAMVQNGGQAGDAGQEIAVNNINLAFDFGGPINTLRMNFGEFGGNLNIGINGDFVNFQNFHQIDGALIGGTMVSVPFGGFGQDQGLLVIDGVINSFAVGGQELWIDHLCQREGNDRLDWGDAPDGPNGPFFNTLAANNGAFHVIDDLHFLGTAVDAEVDGQPTADAMGDDNNGATPDDEDGVKFLTPIVPGQGARVEVTANEDGFLSTWMDFNRNGQWDHPAEQIFSVQFLTPGSTILSFHVPSNAEPGQSMSRWRFTDRQIPLVPFGSGTPDGDRLFGEVEDHGVRIDQPEDRLDWGDAPDAVGVVGYNTLAVNSGAFHRIDDVHFLGDKVDAEIDGQPNLTATGDDVVGTPDDEDGVIFTSAIVPGQMATVDVTASTDGFLSAWLDFNRNGRWDHPAEQIFATTFIPAGTTGLSFMVPAGADTGVTFSRWRFTDQQVPLFPAGAGTASGGAVDGEVEDHVLRITEPQDRFDWGDAPDGDFAPGYQTLQLTNGAFHQIDDVHFLGSSIDAEADGQPNASATGDDLNGAVPDDEDGIRFLTPLVPGQVASVEVTANANGFLSAWLDSNINGVWDHPAEQIFSVQFVAAGIHVFNFLVPATAIPGQTFTRWRFTDVQQPLVPFGVGSASGQILRGEVEDHRVRIDEGQPSELDWGDAPDGDFALGYETLSLVNGAFHVIDGVHFLGNRIDPEADGQPTIGALGDDTNGVDDEDGIRFLTSLRPGQPAIVEVDANANGFLNAWIDFDLSGNWNDPAERIFSVQFVPAGIHNLTFVVPTWAKVGGTYSRWRFTDEQVPLLPGGAGSALGPTHGEVEDHRTAVIGRGDLNDDGHYDCADIDALTMEIASGANNPAFDLTGDMLVNLNDRDAWLAEAGSVNLLSGNPYLLGDATLDGNVDGNDFIEWNTHKFMPTGKWCQADFDADGFTDGNDFIIWNANKFMSSGPIVAGGRFDPMATEREAASQDSAVPVESTVRPEWATLATIGLGNSTEPERLSHKASSPRYGHPRMENSTAIDAVFAAELENVGFDFADDWLADRRLG